MKAPSALAAACRDEWVLNLLLSRGLVTPEHAVAARCSGAPFAAQFLVDARLLGADRIARAVEEQYGIAPGTAPVGGVDKLTASLVPERACRRHLMAPVRATEDSLFLLTPNPLDAQALDEAAGFSGRRPVPLYALPAAVEDVLSNSYGPDAVMMDLLRSLPTEDAVEWVGAEEADEAAPRVERELRAPVTRLVNHLIARAVRMRASDVHVEQEADFTMVRFRVDGALSAVLNVPKRIGDGPLVSRIKIMANLDVAERRRPQDGRAKLRVGGREVGLRVSTVPTAHGETAVLRILDTEQTRLDAASLGLRPELLTRLVRLASAEQGMLLVTGPTGSGKTTTLYSLLNGRRSGDVNIVTVEDPVEYRLPGISQIQVNEKAGLTFASALRSVLRQDPDIILVGEVRDQETADIAFQAALTGHLVFSTLHTNDAVATVNRLLDMKVERYKIAPALMGVVSQRLARRVCPDCRREEAPAPATAALLAAAGLPVRQWKGGGCASCAATGLSGRVAVVELLDLSDREARDVLGVEMDAGAFRDLALRKGWLLPAAHDALCQLSAGSIPYEEAAAFFEAPARAGASAPEATRRDFPAAAAPAGGAEVLVVDDDPDNRRLACDMLAADGFKVLEAADGLAALAALEQRRPGLMLLDIMMPKLDGLGVLKRLRRSQGSGRLPVIILTAMGEAESQALALELGADDYLVKPCAPRLLRARVKALLRRTAAEA